MRKILDCYAVLKTHICEPDPSASPQDDREESQDDKEKSQDDRDKPQHERGKQKIQAPTV